MLHMATPLGGSSSGQLDGYLSAATPSLIAGELRFFAGEIMLSHVKSNIVAIDATILIQSAMHSCHHLSPAALIFP